MEKAESETETGAAEIASDTGESSKQIITSGAMDQQTISSEKSLERSVEQSIRQNVAQETIQVVKKSVISSLSVSSTSSLTRQVVSSSSSSRQSKCIESIEIVEDSDF